MIDQATSFVMQQAALNFVGTGCPQPGSRVQAEDFDNARFAPRTVAVLVPVSNGSRSTCAVLQH